MGISYRNMGIYRIVETSEDEPAGTASPRGISHQASEPSAGGVLQGSGVLQGACRKALFLLGTASPRGISHEACEPSGVLQGTASPRGISHKASEPSTSGVLQGTCRKALFLGTASPRGISHEASEPSGVLQGTVSPREISHEASYEPSTSGMLQDTESPREITKEASGHGVLHGTAYPREITHEASDPSTSGVFQESTTCIDSDSSEEIEETWFETHLMDEFEMDLNKTSKDKLKSLKWTSGYGLAWPNETKEYYHLVVYVKVGELNSDSNLLESLVEVFKADDIKECVELRRKTEELKVRFLADTDNDHDFNGDGAQGHESVAKPGSGIFLQRNPKDFETPFTTIETANVLCDNDRVTSKTGTLTTICHVKNSVPKKSYAITCFHVGYNGVYALESNTQASSLDNFNEHFQKLKEEASRPSPQQSNTTYLYENVPHPLPLGNYAKALFDESHDILLISPHESTDVPFQCPVDHEKASTSLIWKKKRKGKKNIKTVMRIGPLNQQVEGEIKERSSELIPCMDAVYCISSTQPFLMDGDSGSLVYVKVSNNNYKPFAYGVCEINTGPNNYLSACLDLKKSVFKLSEKLPDEEELVLCHRGCKYNNLV